MLQLIERLSFFQARRAPGSPEIQQDHFAAKVGKMGGLAVEREGEVLGGLSVQAGLTLTIIGTREQEEQARNEGQNQASV